MIYNQYSDNLKTAIFDIETSGLNGVRDTIIAASFCDEDSGNLRQYFCDDPKSEFLLITKIIDEFKSLDAIITYNGESFDLPFVFQRARFHGLDLDMPYLYNIDIYRYLKKYWAAGKLLPNLTQTSVEDALGLSEIRTDLIKGSECVSLYSSFLVNGDEKIKETILLHNADDVKQLSRICGKLSFLPYHEIAYKEGYMFIDKSDFPDVDDTKFVVEGVKEHGNGYRINAHTVTGMPSISVFEEYFILEYDSYSGAVMIELIPKELENYTYIDLTKMRLAPSDFAFLDGYASDFLILKQGQKTNYKEINYLVRKMLERVVY